MILASVDDALTIHNQPTYDGIHHNRLHHRQPSRHTDYLTATIPGREAMDTPNGMHHYHDFDIYGLTIKLQCDLNMFDNLSGFS